MPTPDKTRAVKHYSAMAAQAAQLAKHTPAPWTVETVPTSIGVCHKVGPFPGKREGDKPRHACLYADYPSAGNPADDELKANARLIAAAPDLLAALLSYLDAGFGNSTDHAKQGRAYDLAIEAIAKAEGADRMTAARIQACAVYAIKPQMGAVVQIDLDLTRAQRFVAVYELLGSGMSEQEAFEGMRQLFPTWFEAQPAPEVSESSFGEFMAASAA